MLRILWATDVHLNAAEQDTIEAFCDRVNQRPAAALLLGGDIAEAPSLIEWLGFLAERIEMPIYFVLGNHDFYGSSIEDVRNSVRELRHPCLHWLPQAGVVELGGGVALVGQGGWGDARLGNFLASSVILNDYLAIEELARVFDLDALDGDLSRQQALKDVLGRLGDEEAESLRPTLVRAAGHSQRVLCLTHVPPFQESSWHRGSLSDENWLPGFSCKAMGDLLRETAGANPRCSFTVLCGHTHGEGVADILPNLRVHTGEARYGSVDFKVVEIGPDPLKSVQTGR